jgi:phosphatidylglycerophosphatase A
MRQRLSLLFASGLFVGFIPGAPGTYASILTSIAIYLAATPAHRIPPELHASMLAFVTVLGAMAAERVCRSRGGSDPSYIVVDEILGQFAAFLFVPITPASLALGTFLFRVLDILKPFGIRRLERLPHGVGILADDLAAGILACIALHAANLTFFR